VVGFVFAGAPVAYPQILLEKVLVVNDLDQPHALLVTFTPQRPPEEAYEAYDPMLDGHRVTLGLTGYTYHNRPLYYDRGTTSFWVTQEAGIVAIAGALKGTTLPRVAQLDRSSWKDWVHGNPRTRLLVGTDRSQKEPEY
jgi:hypothetical protein